MGALRSTEAVRGERYETTYFASARLDGLLRRDEQVLGAPAHIRQNKSPELNVRLIMLEMLVDVL